MLQRMKEILMPTCLNLLEKKKIDRHYRELYWPNTIKDTTKWFPFLTIMKQNENILKPKQGIITSLLKVFAMFELRLIDDRDKL